MSKIYVIGIGPDGLTPGHRSLLDTCSMVIGAQRYANEMDKPNRRFVSITPLASALETIARRDKQTPCAVLASGDPLFYGVGKTLLEHFPADDIEILPALSSMQLAFARFKLNWEDAVFLSAHGRKSDGIMPLIIRNTKTVVLTDKNTTPACLAGELHEALGNFGFKHLVDQYRVLVGENLGLPGEKTYSGTLTEISRLSFTEPNLAIFLRPNDAQKNDYVLGLSEADIFHSRGLITKDEVRAAVLHKLRLPPHGVFWDIGAGSGSISIEAARLHPELDIHALERSPEQLDNIKKNKARFLTRNLTVHNTNAPIGIAELPRPDRIFIGGSGGYLAAIVKESVPLLRPGGRIVLTAVTTQTKDEAPALLHQVGLNVSISEISIRRSNYPSGQEPQSLNPISIITGES